MTGPLVLGVGLENFAEVPFGIVELLGIVLGSMNASSRHSSSLTLADSIFI